MNDKSKYYIGHAANEQERHKASSGGIGSALIRYLLSLPEFGTSLTFVFNQKGCRYEPKLIHSTDEINVCGSVYQDIDIPKFINEHFHEIEGGIVVSCMPCQVSTTRSILNKAKIPNFIISLVCSGQTTIEGTWCYYKFLGIRKEDVVNMQYRGNGWPSGIQIWLKDGRKVYRDNYTEPWVTIHRSNLFKPKRCFFCKRDTNYNADISLADPWLKEYKESDKTGHTLFVVHSGKGLQIVEEMRDKGIVLYKESDYDSYCIAQKPNIQKAARVEHEKRRIEQRLKRCENKLYHRVFTSSYRMMRIHNSVERNRDRIRNFTFMKLIEKIGNKFRYWNYKKKIGSFKGYFNISGGVIVNNPQCLHLGKGVGIGSNTFIGPVMAYAGELYTPKIIIGDKTWVGKNCSIASIDRVEIGKNVLFAGHVHITDHSHGYEDITKPIAPQKLISKGPVIIEDDCWLGFSCEILSGVHIGKHSIVAARAVVTKDVPPYSIVAGNPARIVKQYNFETKQWERVKK